MKPANLCRSTSVSNGSERDRQKWCTSSGNSLLQPCARGLMFSEAMARSSWTLRLLRSCTSWWNWNSKRPWRTAGCWSKRHERATGQRRLGNWAGSHLPSLANEPLSEPPAARSVRSNSCRYVTWTSQSRLSRIVTGPQNQSPTGDGEVSCPMGCTSSFARGSCYSGRGFVSGIARTTNKRALRAITASPRKAEAYPAPTTTKPATAWLNEPPMPCTVLISPRLAL